MTRAKEYLSNLPEVRSISERTDASKLKRKAWREYQANRGQLSPETRLALQNQGKPPAEPDSDDRLPTLDVKLGQTTAGRAVAKVGHGVAAGGQAAWGVRTGHVRRTDLAKKIRGADSKGMWYKFGRKENVPRFVVKEIDALKKRYPQFADDIEYHAVAKESAINRWQRWAHQDVKSTVKAAKAGYRSGKWRGRRRGVAAAGRELVGIVPRMARAYMATSGAEKRAARDTRDTIKYQADATRVGLKRDRDKDRMTFLRDLRAEAARGALRLSNSAELKHDIDKVRRDISGQGASMRPPKPEESNEGVLFPSIIPAMDLDELMERIKQTRHRGQRGQNQEKIDKRRLKHLDSTKPKGQHGGRRVKKRKRRSTRKSALGKNIAQDVMGRVGSPEDITKGIPTDAEMARMSDAEKYKSSEERPKWRSAISLQKQRDEKRKREMRDRDASNNSLVRSSEGLKESVVNLSHKLEVMGQSSSQNPTMVQKNNAYQVSKKSQPTHAHTQKMRFMNKDEAKSNTVQTHDELRDKARRAIAKSQEMSHKGQGGGSSIGHAAKTAGGKLARATGADELASVPKGLHSTAKHHFIHKFLLR